MKIQILILFAAATASYALSVAEDNTNVEFYDEQEHERISGEEFQQLSKELQDENELEEFSQEDVMDMIQQYDEDELADARPGRISRWWKKFLKRVKKWAKKVVYRCCKKKVSGWKRRLLRRVCCWYYRVRW